MDDLKNLKLIIATARQEGRETGYIIGGDDLETLNKVAKLIEQLQTENKQLKDRYIEAVNDMKTLKRKIRQLEKALK